MTIPERTRRWVVETLGTERIEIATEPIADTVHTNHRLWVGAARRELLLRRFTDDDLLARDVWYSPSDERDALNALARVEAPVTRLVAADVDASRCDVPTLLVTWLPGQPPSTTADIEELVRWVPSFHGAPAIERTYEPYFASDGIRVEDLRPPSWTANPALWERAFGSIARPMPPFDPVFIHRDYHEGNTVWDAGRLTGIVDWTAACAGPAAIDLAHMRMNLTWAFGTQVGDAFVAAWARVVGDDASLDPWWQVLEAVDWLGGGEPRPEHTPERLDRFERYLARALAELV